jgi:hypothetical protein
MRTSSSSRPGNRPNDFSMKTKSTLIAAALLAAAACLPLSASAAPAASDASGWRSLFDGKTLTGWRGYLQEAPGAGWQVKDGVLVLTEKKSGDLVTNDVFGDFELMIEWKVEKGTNSGIMYRVGLGDPHPYESGPEYQVLDNIDGADRVDPKHRASALYDLIAPPKDVTKPVGQWNEARIVVKGWRIEHWLNGEKIIETDLATPEGKTMIAASKFKAFPKYATLSRGHVALQDHGNVVSYRNIRIRELK